MGALDVINNSGAGITTMNGVLPESALPAGIARDTELPTVNDASLTFTGAATGTFTANDSDNLSVNIPSANDGTHTITAGSGLTRSTGGTFTANQSANTTTTLAHADTSSQANVNLSGNNFINSINVDDFGHITSISTGTATGGVSIPSNNGIGTTALMRNESNAATWNNGQSRSGTGIRLTGLSDTGTSLYGTVVSGTWRNTGASLQGSRQTTTGLRIS